MHGLLQYTMQYCHSRGDRTTGCFSLVQLGSKVGPHLTDTTTTNTSYSSREAQLLDAVCRKL
jgi:hypothetical protein